MLTISDVTKDYGKFRAVESITLSLDNGLYGLLAPNGAGKTTLIKMIVTLLAPTSGEILYNGSNIAEMGAAYRRLIGYLPQKFGYYKNNTPRQYLEYLAALKGMPKEGLKGKISDVIDMVSLGESANVKMKKFSGGMLQRVGIAQAILDDPKLLILDEPTAGLDPKERARFRNIISALSKDRIVILSTHIVSDVESIANQVIMIKDKHLYKADTVANICAELEGRVFEANLSESEYAGLQKENKFPVLSARQERTYMAVRFYAEGREAVDGTNIGAKATGCIPNLEDVFLVTYM